MGSVMGIAIQDPSGAQVKFLGDLNGGGAIGIVLGHRVVLSRQGAKRLGQVLLDWSQTEPLWAEPKCVVAAERIPSGPKLASNWNLGPPKDPAAQATWAQAKLDSRPMGTEEFKRLRRELGLSHRHLAGLFGRSTSTTQQWGRGYLRVPASVGLALRMMREDMRNRTPYASQPTPIREPA